MTVRAGYHSPAGNYADATADLVIVANSPVPLAFDGGTSSVTGQSPTAWRYFSVTVPAGVKGWDLRVRSITGGTPLMSVRRDDLPAITYTTPWSYPESYDTWPTTYTWGGELDWTGRTYDVYTPPYPQPGKRIVMGMGRPLEPGNYLVGIYNNHATENAAYTVDSRGIGTGQTYPVTTLGYAAGSSVNINNLAPREAAYYKVTIPAATPSWEFNLATTAGEMMLAVRRDTVPDFHTYENEDLQYNAGAGGSREVELQSPGAERFVLLPKDNQAALLPGDYYIAVISEGVSPPNNSTIGTGTSSGVLTSNGALAITNLGAAGLVPITQALTLAGGQTRAFTFTVPAGTASLEVRLDNRTGDPHMSLVSGTALPQPGSNSNNYFYYGYNGGQYSVPAGGVSRVHHANILTLANPPAGPYSLAVFADYLNGTTPYPDATADLVVIADAPVPLAFDGGTASVSGQAPSSWRFFNFTVPAGVKGWDLRLKNVTGGSPYLAVRRDQLPVSISTTPWYYPDSYDSWPTGYTWVGELDWTGRSYEIYSPPYPQAPGRLVMGMGRPLEPGNYFVGVYNNGASNTAWTIESRGIGAGQTIPVTTLNAAAGSSATISNLPAREAAYFRVTIPPNTPSWECTLAPSAGEMMLALRRDTIPDFRTYESGDLQYNAGTGGNRETEAQKPGPERFMLLPKDDQDFVLPGDYYLAVISEGVNPPNTATVGTGNSSGVLTSLGALAVPNLGPASVAGLTQAVTLAGGQVKANQFTVPAGTQALEVRLDNRVGNPYFCLISGSRIPQPGNTGNTYYYYGYNGGQYTVPAGGFGRQYEDNLLTIPAPPAGTWSLSLRADYTGGAAVYPDATADLVIRQIQRRTLNFDVSQNGNGFSHTDTRQLLDTQKTFYEVAVPTLFREQPVIGWLLKTNLAQGDTTMRIYKTWGNPGTGITVTGNTALIVPPFLTLGDTWFVEIEGIGLTNYTITSKPVTLERPVWNMPAGHNTTFGDSGVDNLGVPLPGDRGVDIGQDDWHVFAIDVPAGNAGLLRTELQAINGNPNLYIRETGVPTTDHNSAGYYGSALYDRSLTASASEYGNWVPWDGRFNNQLRNGRWYIGVKATGGTNARYRLIASTGQVADLALNGGSATAQTLVGRDWRYYRFTVPLDAPNTWSLTFSQTVGDVVMFLRDTVPPGQGGDGLETTDYGLGYTYGLRTWYGDSKNQGPYSNVGHDAPGTYNFTTPPLRPGHTYYAGFRAVNDATFNFSSATSGGSVGVLPVLNFYNGTIDTSIPAGGSLLYRIPVPPEATRLKWTNNYSPSIQLRLEQGTLPGTTGTQHWVGGTNFGFNQPLFATGNWPWLPAKDYYLRAYNTSGSPQNLMLTMNGVNAATEDEDNDGLPDAWELLYYPYLFFVNGSSDSDNDGSTSAQEFANGTNPADFTSAKYTAALNGLHGTAGKAPNTALHDRGTNVILTNSADPGYTFLGWLRGERLDTQYAVRATGSVTIPAAGTWTFGVNSRGGTRLTVNGVIVITDNTNYNDATTFAPVVFPAAGNYPVELIAYDYYGQGDLELFAAPGSLAAFNATFKLVGDTAAGGLTVPGGFALRHVAAGGSQIINTLALADSLLAGTIASKGDLSLVQSVLNHRTSAGTEGSFPNGALFPLQQWLPVSPLTEPMLRNATFHALNTIPLPTALDSPLTYSTAGGDAPWLGENAVTSFDTVDQAYSPPLLDSQQAIMGTTVEGPGVLTFRWKVSSQLNADYLRLYQDASNINNITGDVPWTLYTYNVPAGTHTMSWRYTKDGALTSGSDRGWVDSVVWSPTRYTLTVNASGGTVARDPNVAEYLPGTSVTLTAVPDAGNAFLSYSGDLNTTSNPANINMSANRVVTANFNTVGSAVDSPAQTWTLSNSPFTIAANWFSQSTTTHDGVDAAQSGVITHSQYTQFQTTVTGPNPLTFWWKVSSEATNDPLRFLIDGVEQHRISGTAGTWEQKTYNIAAGSHTLQWRYEKNASLSAGSDAAWVDEIIYGTNNYASWRAANFTAAELSNPAISGPTADPDNDGLTNPWECVLGLNPKSNDSAGLLPATTANPGFLELDFQRLNTIPVDVTLQLYGTSALTPWTLLSSKTGSAAWTVPALITETPGLPGKTRVLARDNAPLATNPRRQIKVEVSVP